MKDLTPKTKPVSKKSDSDAGGKKPVQPSNVEWNGNLLYDDWGHIIGNAPPKERDYKHYEDNNVTTWDIYSG
jgi:hypothetical protein